MTVTITSIIQTDRRNVRIGYESDQSKPVYRVYRDGRQIARTRASEFDVPHEPGDQVQIEVRDDAATPEPCNAGRAWLTWIGAAGTQKYRIEEQVGAEWIVRALVPHHGRRQHRWRTRFLEDGQTHQFRVVPIGENGNDGDAVSLPIKIVRRPDVPTLTFDYNPATRVLTIDEE